MTPDGRSLFTANEGALYQDGPPATVAAGSPVRILRYSLRSGCVDRQWSYLTEPVAESPVPARPSRSTASSSSCRSTTTRSSPWSARSPSALPTPGTTIKLFKVELRGHTARKTLLLDLDDLGIPLDNVEGMTFGPRLRHGRRSLVLVSDNNFAPAQFTQFLLFAVRD